MGSVRRNGRSIEVKSMKHDPTEHQELGAMPLFESPPAQHHSPTSVTAAEAIKPSAQGDRVRLLAYFAQCGGHGATDEQCQQALEMNPSTQRPRRVELANKKLIHKSGETRPTRSGRQAAVWVISG